MPFIWNTANQCFLVRTRNSVAHCMDNTLQLKLALMEGPDFPIALGVIRDVEAPTYDESVAAQIQEVSAKKKYHTFAELLATNDTWEVK